MGTTIDSGSRSQGSLIRGRDVRNYMSLRHSTSLKAPRLVIIIIITMAFGLLPGQEWWTDRNPPNPGILASTA